MLALYWLGHQIILQTNDLGVFFLVSSIGISFLFFFSFLPTLLLVKIPPTKELLWAVGPQPTRETTILEFDRFY